MQPSIVDESGIQTNPPSTSEISTNDSPQAAAGTSRAWLASLMLSRPERFLSRLSLGLSRLRAMPRGWRRQLRRRAAATAVGAALILAMAGGAFITPVAHAAAIHVDDNAVSVLRDGLCSLPEAIINANQNFQFYYDTGECESGEVGLDTIVLPANGSFVLTEAYSSIYGNGLPLVISEIVIEGNGATIERGDVEEKFRILTIRSYGDLTLNDVTISGGYSENNGGGIYLLYDGKLTINDSTISNNTADIYGGGIAINPIDDAFTPELVISNSLITQNKAEAGGGLAQDEGGVMTIFSSTISYNSANYGGGIGNSHGRLNVYNSTISNNDAESGGGIYVLDGDADIINSTITGNKANFHGGGLHLDGGSITLVRSLISGNSSTHPGYEIHDHYYGNDVTADAHNVFAYSGLTDEQAFAGTFSPGASDFNASSDGENVDLGDILDTALADNGGPTKTHNLVLGSPALDFAPDAGCGADPILGLDQRGFVRPFDVAGEGNEVTDTCDAGAVEYFPLDDTAVFMSAAKSGNAGGLAYDNSDILMWDGEAWSKWFDGSSAGLFPENKPKHNTNAFWIPDGEGEEVIMSFAQNGRKVPGITGKVEGMDLVRWDGSAFSLYFDGSDVGLTQKTPEKIDGLHVLPGDAAPDDFGDICESYLLISTQGPAKVPAEGGGQLKVGGEDVLGFCATNLGQDTDGFWRLVVDGSAVGLPKNAVDSISVSDDGETIYMTMKKTVSSPVVAGHSVVIAYNNGTFTNNLFRAADYGLSQKVDGLQVEGEIGE